MQCRACRDENREDASFCPSCGSALILRCGACQRELSADARFCDGCGSPVATSAPSSATAERPADAVRKTVTAMFCDLGGSTGFGERVDAESARTVIGHYHTMLQAVVDDHGGTVAKFIGDGMLAFFGIPEVAEDDAERAVAAAAEMQRRFGAFADEVAERHGELLTFRVGVNSGEVVIGEGDADIVGDVLNVAARLEKACEPGRVLVGEATWRLTRGSFAFEAQGEVAVTGRAEPVSAYLLGESDPERVEDATPFVGREAELVRLHGVLDQAIACQAARFVTVIGPPGVGKTRLSRELEQSVTASATVLHTACDRSGAATFAPLVDLLRPALGLVDGADEVATRAALAGIVPVEEAERERIVDGLAGIVGVGEARSTEETFWAVRRLIESLAAAQPLVLVVDDIQWGESLLLDLLDHLAEWVADAAVLVMCLARPELRDVRPAMAEPGRRMAEVIALEGLDASATAQLAAQMLGGDGLPAELLARLPASTDGNPLFVRELVRMLVDEEIIVSDGDTWRLTVDADAVEVPPTIRSLLAARIERLPAAERVVLERASVLGTEFTLGGLGALVDDPTSVGDRLERLRRRDLVEPTGAYWGDDPQYRFHHVLLRDAVYGRLLKAARAELHELAGNWTEAAAARLVGEHGPAVAHHFEQAHHYVAQLGALDDHGWELGRRAADLLAAAAQSALARDDLVAAGSLATRGLACLTPDDRDRRAELLLIAGEAVLGSGDLTPAANLVDALDALGATDARLIAWAESYRAQLLELTAPDRLDEAEALAVSAAGRFTALGDGSGQAKAHLVQAGLLARRGRVADSEAELDRGLSAAREAGDQRRLVAVLGKAPAAALWGPSPVARAGGRCLDVVRLLRITAASPAVEATSTRHQAVLEAHRGRLGAARSLLATARETVEGLGLRRDLMEVELFAGLIEALAGDPAAAEGHLRIAHAGLADMGVGADAALAAALLARALLDQGRTDEAETLAADAAGSAGQGLQAGIAWRTVRARLLAAAGDHEGAATEAEEAVAVAAGTDLLLDHADACATLATVRHQAGDETRASTAGAEADRLYTLKGSTVHAGAPVPVPVPVDSAAAPRSDAELDARYLAGEGAAYASVLALHRRWQAALADRDWEAVTSVFAPDLRVMDHRPLGVGVLDRDAWVAHTRSRFELADDIVQWSPSLQIDGAILSMTVAGRGTGPAGTEVTWFSRGVVVMDLERDHWVSVDIYHEDDAGGAQARFEELVAEAATTDAKVPAQPGGLDNLAVRQLRRMTHLVTIGDLDAAAALNAEDIVTEDRRRGLRMVTEGRAAHLVAARALHETLHGAEWRVPEVLAVRGDRLALARYETAGRFTVDSYTVAEVDAEGRARRSVVVDLDDLADAADLLEQWYGEGDGREFAEILRLSRRLGRSIAEGDARALEPLLTDDFEMMDHRPVGWGSRDRETLLTVVAVRPSTLGSGVNFGSALLRLDPTAVLSRYEIRATSNAGIESTEVALALVVTRDGKAARLETFAEGAVADAERRFDALLA